MRQYTVSEFYMACESLVGTKRYEINKGIINFNVPVWCEYISRLLLLDELNDESEALQVIKVTAHNLWRSDEGVHKLL